MNGLPSSADDLLINGAMLPSLWRTAEPGVFTPCAVTRRTIAASRWGVRYEVSAGAEVAQAFAGDRPADSSVAGCLVLRASAAVGGRVFVGQRIEAAEASRYGRRLRFTAWVCVAGSGDATLELQVATPCANDVFGGPQGDGLALQTRLPLSVPRGRWTRLEALLDGRNFPATGLSVELAFPPDLFPGEVRLADLHFAGSDAPWPPARPAAIEAQLAGRFFQRHDSSRINSIGRALVVNPHELHFQFTFPEMRAFPACTLPHSEDGLRVFSLDGIPQSGFRYDVTYRSRGSVILRATRENHGLTGGFLSFVGTAAAILLDAEL